MIGRILKHPIKFDRRNSTDSLDNVILIKIGDGIDGTIELAKKVGIAPKNLLHRLKKHTHLRLIQVSRIKQKPKGWKRHYKLSPKGKKWVKTYADFQNKFREMAQLK